MPLLCVLLASRASEATVPAVPGALELEPNYVPIHMTFEGATIHVRADVPAGDDAAIRVMGQDETLEMKRKGKVGYVMWMSIGEVSFEAVPRVYVVLTSAALAGPRSAPLPPEWKLGYAALARSAGWHPAYYPELIKLKQGEGCFLVAEGQLARAPGGGGVARDRLSGAFRLPARVPAGDYTVDLFGVHEGGAVHLGTRTLRLEYVGLARLLRTVAMHHGLTYGIVAIVVAVVAGLGTAFIFQPRRGRPR